jgi:hypothetical protein
MQAPIIPHVAAARAAPVAVRVGTLLRCHNRRRLARRTPGGSGYVGVRRWSGAPALSAGLERIAEARQRRPSFPWKTPERRPFSEGTGIGKRFNMCAQIGAEVGLSARTREHGGHSRTLAGSVRFYSFHYTGNSAATYWPLAASICRGSFTDAHAFAMTWTRMRRPRRTGCWYSDLSFLTVDVQRHILTSDR